MMRIVGAGAVVVAALALTACADAGSVAVYRAGNAICAHIDDRSGDATIGVTMATAYEDVEITDIVLVDSDNIEVVGWYLAWPADDSFIGAVDGFAPPAGAGRVLRTGQEGHLEVGFALVDPARIGRVESVRLEYRGQVLARTPRTGPDITLMPPGRECEWD